MSAMSDKHLEMQEIAESGTNEAKIREFGSIEAAQKFLDDLDREAGMEPPLPEDFAYEDLIDKVEDNR